MGSAWYDRYLVGTSAFNGQASWTLFLYSCLFCPGVQKAPMPQPGTLSNFTGAHRPRRLVDSQNSSQAVRTA